MADCGYFIYNYYIFFAVVYISFSYPAPSIEEMSSILSTYKKVYFFVSHNLMHFYTKKFGK